MERDVLEGIPEFQELLKALKMAGVADLVWGVLGGHPASYDLLKTDWVEAGSPLGAEKKEAVVKVAEAFMKAKLKSATKTFKEAKDAFPSLVPIYDKFKTVDVLPADAVTTLPADKVLRLLAKKNEDEDVVVPASPAMALVLRYSVGNKSPPLEVVRKALGTK